MSQVASPPGQEGALCAQSLLAWELFLSKEVYDKAQICASPEQLELYLAISGCCLTCSLSSEFAHLYPVRPASKF